MEGISDPLFSILTFIYFLKVDLDIRTEKKFSFIKDFVFLRFMVQFHVIKVIHKGNKIKSISFLRYSVASLTIQTLKLQYVGIGKFIL